MLYCFTALTEERHTSAADPVYELLRYENVVSVVCTVIVHGSEQLFLMEKPKNRLNSTTASAPRLLSSLYDASPPSPTPLSQRLIPDSLNKTQIKTDNEESPPPLLYSQPLSFVVIVIQSWMATCSHVCARSLGGDGGV
ncbi:uncharacterized protein V6R79_004547 [Siganus canaliculatus]